MEEVLELAFATPGDWSIGLCTDSVIAKTAVFTDLTEVSGSGYARIPLTSIIISTYATDDKKAVGNEVTFSATGTWTEAVNWFCVVDGDTSGTYKLICWNALSEAVTLTNGESQAAIGCQYSGFSCKQKAHRGGSILPYSSVNSVTPPRALASLARKRARSFSPISSLR